jgi:hypothetical protein
MKMTLEEKLESALQKVEELTELITYNEYEHFFVSNLLPVEFEIKRQLTNIRHSAKIKK